MYNFKEVVKVESEAVTRRCSLKEVSLEISQNSQENTCSRVSGVLRNFTKFTGKHLF